jgi:hypothetical protein
VHLAVDVAGGPADGLNQRRLGSEETLLVRVEDPVSVARGRRTQGPVTETEVLGDTDWSDEFPSCQWSVVDNNIPCRVA